VHWPEQFAPAIAPKDQGFHGLSCVVAGAVCSQRCSLRPGISRPFQCTGRSSLLLTLLLKTRHFMAFPVHWQEHFAPAVAPLRPGISRHFQCSGWISFGLLLLLSFWPVAQAFLTHLLLGYQPCRTPALIHFSCLLALSMAAAV
jgi:hypothetical protein